MSNKCLRKDRFQLHSKDFDLNELCTIIKTFVAKEGTEV